MKKKIIFAVATGLFAVATVFNMNVLQSNNAGDVSLDAIAVMAQAATEYGGSDGTCCNNSMDVCEWDDGFRTNGYFI
ncbi:hypothetical protein ACT3CD_11410 [Geofilum sp. OHC36d9]|uniref:hypothetical protein n=1 Tax=Geofilum sp. OHC36d9 TaxID=3458413 RepID=UPI0040343B38